MVRRSSFVIAALVALSACAQTVPVGPLVTQPAPLAAPQHVALTASAGRIVDVSVWRAARPKGIILFNHGYGGEPAAYGKIIHRWLLAGYTVVGPRAIDSRAGPLHGEVDPKQAFRTRVEDLALTRAYVARTFPRRPVVLAGHSFGSLIALIGGGAVTPAGRVAGPPVAGVIAFSSPGLIPDLVTRDSFSGVTLPLLVITGDADVVPGYAADWHDHRVAFDRSPSGEKTLLVVKGGTHDLVANGVGQDFDTVANASVDFLDAYAAGNAAARTRLTGLKSTDPIAVERR